MFANKIISWYHKNRRDLPWRTTKNPYFIWLSEVILQQTRVLQGLPYYYNFIEKYPTIQDLASADESEILRTWQGLGYYSRARNLLQTSKFISNELNGVFPNNFNSLKMLKGIGNYTAAAIASFAFAEVVPAIDGNVIRVLSRFFEFKEPVDSERAKKTLFEIAKKLISKENPADFNQALMELGAMVCTPKQPKCSICPLNDLCLARKNSSFGSIPLKVKKTKVVNRYINYLVFVKNNKIWMKQRKEQEIWAKMYDFFEIETETNEFDLLLHLSTYLPLNEIKNPELLGSFSIVHILSHQRLFLSFHKILISNQNIEFTDGEFKDWEEIEKLPKPIAIENYLKKMY